LAYPSAATTYSFVGNDEAGEITWYTTYARVPDDFSAPITVLCPPNGDVTTSIIIGTDVYRADSAVCVAAVHAGIITVAAGGRVTVTLQPKRDRLTASTRNGITSQPWSAPDYLLFSQPYSVTPGAITLTTPTSVPATLAEPRLLTTTTAVNPAVVAATSSSQPDTASIVTERQPASSQPTVLSNGPAPTGLTVTGTPTTATVQWLPVAGATGYRVNRAVFGTTQWTAVTPTPVAETASPTDELTDWTQIYTYQVLAYQPDGSFGAATIDYVPAKPQDPSQLSMTAAFQRSAVISWQPVEGVWGYLVSGPGLTPSVETTATTFSVSPPRGSGVYQVASIYRPGGVLTPQSAWPSVTAFTSSGPSSPGLARPGTTTGTAPTNPSSNTGGATCACTRTGGFRNPTLRTLDEDGLTGSFSHPTAGSFTVRAQSVNGTDMLDIYDSQNRVVLSESKPAAWGLSPDNRYFALASTPESANTSSPLRVFRVAAGPDRGPVVIGTSAYSSGRWGFSAGSKIFLMTRLENGPIRFTFQAFNLEAANPGAAMLQVSEANVSGPSVTTSPCDDRLMYFRWTQLNPLDGGAVFYDRFTFGPNAQATLTSWDEVSRSTPSASIVGAGTGSSPFMVDLNGLVTGGNATSFPSLQCTQ
jgi:hypothetical protein